MYWFTPLHSIGGEKLVQGAGRQGMEFIHSKYLLSINFESHTIHGARQEKMKKAQALTLKNLIYS